jgi:hypothetical protein
MIYLTWRLMIGRQGPVLTDVANTGVLGLFNPSIQKKS